MLLATPSAQLLLALIISAHVKTVADTVLFAVQNDSLRIFIFFLAFRKSQRSGKWIKVSQSELKWVKVSQKESNLAQISQKKSKWVKILHITYRNATWLIFQVRIQCVLPQSRHHKRHSVADTCSSNRRSQENPYAETLKCSTDFSKEPTLWRVCIEKLIEFSGQSLLKSVNFILFYFYSKMTWIEL